jgi:predicted ArsR family transcriptional regulator
MRTNTRKQAVKRLTDSGMSVRETAEALGITTQAVRYHLGTFAKEKGTANGRTTTGKRAVSRKVR